MNLRTVFHRWVSAKTRRAVRRRLACWGWEHRFLRLRRPGFARLRGEGIEVGAFEHPAPLPVACRTRYVDAITPEEAAELFPEIDASALIRPDFIADVSQDGLKIFPDGKWDYVVACHVIEHLPNPGRFIGELFRVVRFGGRVAIAAPDKRFTFDAARPETPTATLQHYFHEGRNVTEADYADISRFVVTTDLRLPETNRRLRLREYMERREHLSVWTSASFREFLVEALRWNRLTAEPMYEVDGDKNGFEYFGVWQKGGHA